MARLIGTVLAVAVLLQQGLTATVPTALGATTKPNIVVFYIDDVAPTDGRLWTNPALTPTIYKFFVAHGTHFSNAIGETPLCCPGRASLLTGLHTQNHGVIKNDGRLFNPGETIGLELKQAGYSTNWVGKYLNLDNRLTAAQWAAHGAGWTNLDAIYGVNGAFTNYTVHTKTGPVFYGPYHSTQMAADRTVMHFRQTPPNVPIFSIVSIFNLHTPNVPMPGFETDPRWAMCDQMPPWKPPNYNEADVSDKPAYVRNAPLLPDPNGWPMAGYCKEMLGVDWAVKRVTDELASDGRLANTTLVFTADNGMTWGAHRLGEQKTVPYATPVPLYVSRPGRWDTDPREITDTVSNIDLAPTLCAIGGCQMGPYPTGQTHADGVSLLPLFDGTAQHLARDAVLESAWIGTRTWTAIRTSPTNPLGQWHYVEYITGERELYDLTNDPWELQNRAADPTLANIKVALAQRLYGLRVEGLSAHPDLAVASAGSSTFAGKNLFFQVPTEAQTRRRYLVKPGTTVSFTVRLTNTGGTTQSITFAPATILGRAQSGANFYNSAGQDVTAAVVGGSYRVDGLLPNASSDLTVRVVVDQLAPLSMSKQIVLRAAFVSFPTRVDVVQMFVLRGYPPTPK